MKPFKRAGLHRLECSCGAYAYATVADLERALARHGSLHACACGGAFRPDRLELAMLLGLEDCPAVDEYRTELQSVSHGQAPHGIRGREMRSAETVALERCETRRRDLARERRIGALLPVPEPIPF